MTHDPLCPLGQPCHALGGDDHLLYKAYEGLTACDCCDRTCCCDVIAKVRADERNRALSRIQSLPDADLMARTMYRADIVHALVCPVAGCLDKIEHTIWATPKPT